MFISLVGLSVYVSLMFMIKYQHKASVYIRSLVF